MALYVDCHQTTFLSSHKYTVTTLILRMTLQTATHFISKVPDVYVCDVIVLRLPAT